MTNYVAAGICILAVLLLIPAVLFDLKAQANHNERMKLYNEWIWAGMPTDQDPDGTG